MILNIYKNTVIKILRNSLHLEKRYAKWISYILSDEQKAKKVQVSIELKNQLQSLIVNQLTVVIACDEAWFYLSYYNNSAWVEVGSKIMGFTAFSIAGIVLVKEFPPNASFNSTTMCQTILKWIIHFSG